MKKCFKCGLCKETTEFYRHSNMADGLLGKCKTCTKNDVKEARLARIDYYRKYDRLRANQPHRKELNSRVSKKWKEKFPNRRAAQIMLGNAVKRGEIVPMPCMVCGEKAEAHHPDYDQPLSVVWLCPHHHKQAHALVKQK